MAKAWTLKTLEAEVARVADRLRALEARRDQLTYEIAVTDDEIAALRGGRRPGRPRKLQPPRGRPGRPPGAKPGRKPRRKFPRKTGLTDFVRAAVAKKALSVAKLTTLAGRKGYKSKNLPQVIRLMVGKAGDLVRRPDDTIAKK